MLGYTLVNMLFFSYVMCIKVSYLSDLLGFKLLLHHVCKDLLSSITGSYELRKSFDWALITSGSTLATFGAPFPVINSEEKKTARQSCNHPHAHFDA